MQQLQSNPTSKRCVKTAVSKLPAKATTKPQCRCVGSHPQQEPAQGALPRPEYALHSARAGVCSHIHSALSTCEHKVKRREMIMRKRLLTLQKRESVGRTMVSKTMLQTSILPLIRGELRDRCMQFGHRSSCWPLTHGATQQILFLTEARRCQSGDWAQHWAQLELQGPATHWALFCLSEKHQLLAPGSYWNPNSTEPATQRELAVALDIDIANLFSAITILHP